MQITLDEGYQFGLGVFETIAIEKGRPLLLSWHLERLNRSLEELGIPQSVEASEAEAWLAKQDADHHALKIMVSAENKLFTLRRNHYTQAQYDRGFRLSYSTVYRNETSPLVRHKTMNYGDCILEKRRAASLGIDELIFKNSRGEICEGTVSNIFFVRDGRLFTPPLSCGLLPGIVRRFLLENFPVTEQKLYMEEIASMDECFLTNSLMGIMPAASLEGHSFPCRAVTNSCMELYRTKNGI